jgi:demethylmenaquinone methyltransferase/2-methoxy-6-polyprenyl-1,4-benzoquinol methylase
MTRVVRDGGVVMSLDFTRPPNHIFREIYYLYLVRLMPLLGRLVSPDWARTFDYLAASILAFQPPHSVAEKMRRVGLRRIRARPLTGGIVTLLTGHRSG